MTFEELKEQGAIYFEKINSGFNDYDDVKITLDAKMALNHFKNLKKEYGADHAFVDFYYYNLDPDSREMVDELLNDEEIRYLSVIAPIGDPEEELVFPLDDKLLKIVTKLNAEEMLFSTIYFTEKPGGRARTTWWGNYEKEYICFKDR